MGPLKKMESAPTFKLLLMGDSGTGKSSLLLRFIEDRFLGEDSQPATIGVDFKVRTISIDDKPVKLTIWDTAGQERFRALTSSYYRGAHGIILVYDITSKASFDSLNDWIHELDVNSSIQDSVKMVVGNKTDRQEERAVPKERAVEYCRSIGALFTESSAKTDDNVQEAFRELVRKIIESPHLLQAPAIQNDLLSSHDTLLSACGC